MLIYVHARAFSLDHNAALKACFSQACDHSVLSPTNISTAKLIGFLSNQKPCYCFYLNYIFIFCNAFDILIRAISRSSKLMLYVSFFKLENVNRKAQCFQYNQLKGIKLKLTKTV